MMLTTNLPELKILPVSTILWTMTSLKTHAGLRLLHRMGSIQELVEHHSLETKPRPKFPM